MGTEQVLLLLKSVGVSCLAMFILFGCLAFLTYKKYPPEDMKKVILSHMKLAEEEAAQAEAAKKRKKVIISYVPEQYQAQLEQLTQLPPKPAGWTESKRS